MRKSLAILGAVIGAALCAPASAADTKIEIPGAAQSAEACVRANASAASPEEAAAVFVSALLAYETDQETARACFEALVDDNYLSGGGLSEDFNYLIDVGIARHPEIARSYIKGATPQNGYSAGDPPWTLVFTRDARFKIASDVYRVKLRTSGQPTSRPISLRLVDGRYRVNEASTLFVGVARSR